MIGRRRKTYRDTVRGLWFVAAAVLLAAGTAGADPFVPNDPYYTAGHQWYADTLNLPEAWSVSLGTRDVTVAVLDSGVLADTPDLAGRVLGPLTATGEVLDPALNRHGTWVASSAFAGVDNGIGGAGVANVSVLPITVTNANGSNASADLARGIRMAADAGARVINLSQRAAMYDGLDEAAAYARGRGALTFVAAGNDNERNLLIADYEHLIFVSGTDAADQRWVENAWTGSTWGPFVDLSAPASQILVADPVGFPSGYGLADGTSYAAPLAAGTAALAWSIAPDLEPEEVWDLLRTTAVDLGDPGRDEVYGYGRIDVGAVAAGAAAGVPEPATMLLLGAGAAAVLGRRRRRG
ncbi:MAG: S8 family serine peptidase [Phycisphaerae bacterium]